MGKQVSYIASIKPEPTSFVKIGCQPVHIKVNKNFALSCNITSGSVGFYTV